MARSLHSLCTVQEQNEIPKTVAQMAGIKEKTVREAIAYRRSVRAYTDESLDDDKVKDCIQQATFAPTSSNLQLWEFYHVTDKEKCNFLMELDQGESLRGKRGL